MPTMKKNLNLQVGDRVYYKPNRFRQMITTITDEGGHRDINELNHIKDSENVIFYDASKMDSPALPKGVTAVGEFNSFENLKETLKNIFEGDRKVKVYIRTIYQDGTIVAGYVKDSESVITAGDDMVLADSGAEKYIIFMK